MDEETKSTQDPQQIVGIKKNPIKPRSLNYCSGILPVLWQTVNLMRFLCYSLELGSQSQHSNDSISCMKHFASDGPGSNSGKSTLSFRLQNLTPIYFPSLIQFPVPTNPPTDYSTFPPSHILNKISPCSKPISSSAEWGLTVPSLTETCKTQRKMSYTQQIPNKCSLLCCPFQSCLVKYNPHQLLGLLLQVLHSSLLTYFCNLILLFFIVSYMSCRKYPSTPPIRMQRRYYICIFILHEASIVWWV